MNKVITIIILTMSILNAWEINTHRAIDKETLDLLKEEKSNLNTFVKNTNIAHHTYADEKFSGYGSYTYFDYIDHKKQQSDGVSDWNQTFNGAYNYQDIIEAGSILEDSMYSDGLFSGDGRFNNHFYDPQHGGKGLTIGFGRRVNALQWTTFGWRNSYNYEQAILYYDMAFSEASPERRNMWEAMMLVSVGFILHMVNDMNVPAHTRDDSHPFHEPLEKYMRGGEKGTEDIGFYVRENSIRDHLNIGAVNEINKYDNFAEYMITEATYTSTHFVTENTALPLKSYDNNATHPNANDVILGELQQLEYGLTKGYYISKENGQKLAIHLNSKLLDLLNDLTNLIPPITASFDGDNSVLEENGAFLVRRAIANAKGFVEYFFRGQIEVKVTNDGIVVKNISNPNRVKETDTITFKKEYTQRNDLSTIDGEIQIYWDDEEGVRHALLEEPHKLSQDLAPNEVEIIDELNQDQKEKLINHHITVVYKGVIGKEKSVAVDATVTKERDTTATLAFYYVYNCAGEVAGLKFKVYTTTNGESKLLYTREFQGFYLLNREPNSDWIIKETSLFKDENLYSNDDTTGVWEGKVLFESSDKEEIKQLINQQWSPEIYRFIRVNRGGGWGGIGSTGAVIGSWGSGDGCSLPLITYSVQTARMAPISIDQNTINSILESF